MKVTVHVLPRISVGFAACAAIAMGGCSNGSNAGPKITAAKNLYVIQNSYNQTTTTESDVVLAFSADATGRTMPTATLAMPADFVAYSIATGPTGELYIGGESAPTDGATGEVLVYAAGATGSATPTATLMGGAAGTFNFPDYITVDATGKLYVGSDDGSIEVFAAGATGAAAPAQYITYGMTNIGYPDGLGVDKAGEVFVESYTKGAIFVYAAGATGADVPVRSITGTADAAFTGIFTMTVDGEGTIYASNYNQADDPFRSVRGPDASPEARHNRPAQHRREALARPQDTSTLATAIMAFAPGASGTPAPTRTISGSATLINEPDALAIDGLGNLYYQDFGGGAITLMMFPPAATGNVAPSSSMTSTAFTTTYSGGMAAF